MTHSNKELSEEQEGHISEAIADLEEAYFFTHNCFSDLAFEKLKGAIELGREAGQEWISVEDRLPEDGQEVLYYFEITGINQGVYRDYNTFTGPKGFLTGDVTYWMPLPNSPQTGE